MPETNDRQNPVVIIVPYLALGRSYEFGDWWIGPVDAYSGKWSPPKLGLAVGQLLRRFVNVEREPVSNPTLISSRGADAGGPMPQPDTISALTLAVQFATLAANPTWKYKSGDAEKAVALENVDIWFQPVDLVDKFISLHRGSRIKMHSAGHRYDNPALLIAPSLELPPQRIAAFDPAIAEAVFDVLTNPPEGNDLAIRLRPAIHWWVKAWSNNANVSDEDRILYLKIAIEALTDSSDTATSAATLTKMFRRVPAIERQGLLWKDDEPSFTKTQDTGGPNLQPALTHFICNFGFQRNRVIHDGKATSLEYVQDGSPYAGVLVDVADRVIREGILVALGECGHPDLWRSVGYRELCRLVAEGSNDSGGLVFNVTETLADGWWALTVKEVPEITEVVQNTEDTVAVITKRIAESLGIHEDSFTVYTWPEIRSDPEDLTARGRD